MKTLKYSFLALFFSVVFTSCVDDFLEVSTDKVAIPDSIVFSDPNMLQMYILTIYDNMGKDRSYRNRADYYYHANTDIERNKSVTFNQSINASNGAGVAMYYTSESDAASGFEEVWNYTYQNIESCNQIIEYVPLFGDPVKNKPLGALYAEALALRSYFYYNLIAWWGDVPARWTTGDDTYQPSKREDIYDHILADLLEAESYVTDGQITSVLHPTLAGIQAFRARVALAAAGYAQRPISQINEYEIRPGANSQNSYAFVGRVKEEKRNSYYQIAKDECTSIISRGSGAGQLMSSFQDVFLAISRGEENPANTESLWEMRYRNQFVKGWGLRHDVDTYTPSRATGDRGWVVGSLWWDYDKNDIRRDVSLAPWYWKTGAITAHKMNEISFAKLRPEWASGNTDMIPDAQGDTYRGKVIIRYADVLLMHAEACLALGQVAEGQPSFNKVRDRAFGGSAPYKELTWDNLMDERKFEFVGEQIRKNDLIRWGKLKEFMDKESQKCIDLQNAHNNNPSQYGYDYSDVPKKVWSRMSPTKNDPVINQPVIELYGMNKGEILPEGDTPGNDWTSVSMWSETSLAGAGDPAKYYEKCFYRNNGGTVVDPDLRNLLPISSNVVSASGRLLKNQYGY